jgi:small subunit ribosomal protein S26
LKAAEVSRQKQIEESNRIISAETEAIENRIQEEDLERVIEAALQNPVDHEFAIDLEGNIYRGRYTKSIEVPKQDREKIPDPPTVAEKILSGQTSY